MSKEKHRLTKLFERARLAPFWRERLAKAGYAADLEPAEFSAVMRALPPLTRDDLLQHGPPHSLDMLTGPLEAAYVFRTGGTSGRPKFSLFSVGEFRAMTRPFLQAYRAAGLRPSDRVANLFVCNSLYASFIFVNRCLEEMGTLNFPYTMAAPAELLASQWGLFGLNTVIGVPSHLLQVMPVIGPNRIEKVFYAGEHLHKEARWRMQQEFGVKHIASGGYGAVDTGLMGYQCERCQGAEHHVLSEHAWLEIVDPESWQPVEYGAEGLILVTCLDRFLMPILRYSIGDLGRFMVEPCPCGREEPRFELLRRGDDALRIGVINVAYDEIQNAIGDAVGALQLVKERESGRDRLRIRLEPRAELPDLAGLRQRILTSKPDFAKIMEQGLIGELVLEMVPPGALARSPLTGKLFRTEDRS
ncbi:MAG: hypothetical protein HY692_03225 [Cyanobacteria bacterium NC_groundwater_1444_Ag_S-0.65um_54_12]|nr:hypothetical protein [Cyanobacteria bacterium NC_groundwater_1444_Ag_S-0.65um_54_12]